jgi:hypothetical protein
VIAILLHICLDVRLVELVKTSHFHCEDQGFESPTEYIEIFLAIRTMKTKKKATPKRAPKKSTAIARIEEQPAKEQKSLVRQLSNPQDVLNFATVLKDFIVKNQLSVKIDNNDYAMVSAWQFTGTSFGLTAIVGEPVSKTQPGEYVTTLYINQEFRSKAGTPYTKQVPVFCGLASDVEVIESIRKRLGDKIVNETTKQHYKYECRCEVRRLSDNSLVSTGVAVCSNMEKNKTGFEEYAISSMCQTRSMGKAYRNILGFIMKSAGYQDTPQEEMEGVPHFVDAQVVHETGPTKSMNDAQFAKFLGRLKDGEPDALKNARKFYIITTEQQQRIDAVLNAKM